MFLEFGTGERDWSTNISHQENIWKPIMWCLVSTIISSNRCNFCCIRAIWQATKEEEELIAEEEEELTPEEKRKLERKLKKERKKKEKQLMREAGIPIKKVEPKKPSGCERALAYLTSWSKNPEEWKFQKTRQTWLLLHMYDKEKVPDKYFTILLDYLQGLQGNARDKTVQKAEAFMKEFDGSDGEDPNLLGKCERIRQVLQLLS
uniref:WKF domain-containing protein n=1 Tax=Geospiza parvula TaxID=87175 RepID=A0A8C3M549_GEOPR